MRPCLFFTPCRSQLLQLFPAKSTFRARTVDPTAHASVQPAVYSSPRVALPFSPALSSVCGCEAGRVGVRDRSPQVSDVRRLRNLGLRPQERRVHKADLRLWRLRGNSIADGLFGGLSNTLGNTQRVLDLRRPVHLHILCRSRPSRPERQHGALGACTP